MSTNVDWNNYKSQFIDEWTQDGYNFAKVVYSRNGTNDTGVSEGMGYGMLMAVQNNDQETFDKLLAFVLKSGFTDANGLLNWKYDQTGITGQGSATDGDQDIAYALLLADKKWGESSSFNYLTTAKTMISAIGQYDIDDSDPSNPKLLPGDGWGSGGDNYFNPSYVDPTEWAAFAAVDTVHAQEWDALISSSLNTLMNDADPNTGLVGNWPDQAPDGYTDPKSYGYDACRVPTRLANYYEYLSGLQTLTPAQQGQMTQIKDLLNKQFSFFFNHQMGPGQGIYAGYSIDGTTNVGYGDKAAFNGPLMEALNIMIHCNGIDTSKISLNDAKTFLGQLQTLVNTETKANISGGPDSNSNNYYNASLGLLNEGWEIIPK